MRENYRLYKLYKMVQKDSGNTGEKVEIDYSLLSGNNYTVTFSKNPIKFLTASNDVTKLVEGATISTTGHYKGGGSPDAAIGNYFRKDTNEVVRHLNTNNTMTYYAYFSDETLSFATALTDTSAYTTPGYYTIDYTTMSIIERVGSTLILNFTYTMSSIRSMYQIVNGVRKWIDINTDNEEQWKENFKDLIIDIQPYEETIEVKDLKDELEKRPDTSDATAVADNILLGKTAYANNTKIEGTIETYTGSYEGTATVENEWGEVLINLVSEDLGANVKKLPEGTTSIRPYAFYKYANLGLTELPTTLKTIGAYAFQQCTNMPLTSVGQELTTVAQYAFDACSNLAITELPESLISIGQYAFRGCSNLKLTKLPEDLTTIANYAFDNCTNLALTKLPSNLITIGSYAFSSCFSLALEELPNTITTISSYAFDDCNALKITKLPDNLTSLGSGAFNSCDGLTTLEVPAGIKTFSTKIFYSCTNLTTLILNAAVTSIGTQVFYNCKKLTKLVLPNITTVPTLSNTNAFANTPMASGTGYIYVPDDLVESFKTASNWSTYANQIKPISEMEG